MFDSSGVDRVCRRIAKRGGERMTEWTRINTPIGHHPFDESYMPGRLRASIEEKMLVVTVTRRGVTYETGCETNVSYAPYVEYGTGIYHIPEAHTEWEITPRRPGGWLSWIDRETGERLFAKRVVQKGIHPQSMFAIGAHMTEFEFDEFAGGIVRDWARDREVVFQLQPPIFVGKRI